jgi:hypothetical protein
MGKAFETGWLVVITQDSKVARLRLSAAMDMGSFARFEYSQDG